MKEKTKKIILWTSVGLILSASIAAGSGFVIMQQKINKKTIDHNNKDKKEEKENENKTENDKQKNNIDNEKEVDPNDIGGTKIEEVEWSNIFPKIQSSDYYNKLNYRNGQAWIDENMIVYIIKDVLNRMLITDGIVKYAYKQLDDQNLLITFKWNNDKQKSVVTYKISTNKL
ncbi:hypothetical protein DMC14_001675 [Metamycoplasma phocicerebrale]|uniref:Uncharacterized protein n=1 Tax=Metamycoplasma phocicerebrale TaxID=142649 RepID=A0A3Q9VA61_9BACT|nr:hypothetical protein [Metamycoplasma phocicerebrale]AZZ65493.1 hypothetical protein DMC14_001675 [Metamycoplasma phocicerebrale]